MDSGHNKNIGAQGEDAASNHYRDSGYALVEKNWTVSMGEIDLILKKKDTLVFVEVKTSSNYEFGNPAERITYLKKEKLIRLVNLYLASNPQPKKIKSIRVDAAEVIKNGDIFKVDVIENIIEL